jgi:hypothetical protein
MSTHKASSDCYTEEGPVGSSLCVHQQGNIHDNIETRVEAGLRGRCLTNMEIGVFMVLVMISRVRGGVTKMNMVVA